MTASTLLPTTQLRKTMQITLPDSKSGRWSAKRVSYKIRKVAAKLQAVSGPSFEWHIEEDAYASQLDEIDALAKDGKPRHASVQLIGLLDKLLEEGLFDDCDELIELVDAEAIHSDLLLTVLMATFADKNRLKGRPAFVEKAFHRFVREFGVQRAEEILRRLA